MRGSKIKKDNMKNLIAVFLMCVSISAFASFDPTVPDSFSWDDMDASFKNKNLHDSSYTQQIKGNYQNANQIQTGLKVITDLTVDNPNGYELIGIYSGAIARGANTAKRQKVTGILGAAFKVGKMNAFGLECDVFDFEVGGTSSCLGINFTLPNPGAIGIRMQPPSYATGLIGVSFADNPQAYKYATDYAGAPVAMGSKSGSHYCIKFNETTAELEYIKNCGSASEVIVGTLTITPPKVIYTKPTR